ncbi:type VI secretion system protein TssA [Colwellia sp. UCD-KL20]|uniref:type VI secretion system protein TssA n=1 Tax=Colwellia sp. UCD-KL20 TaxID=1917165 RepID=UPI00257074B7|nr:type VI secretion system protein TssA [Colwellia sp. UCD-KL20]
MNSSIFEITDLIQPISNDAPTGIDPREDVTPNSNYYLLKEIRNTARAKERKALIDEDNVQAIATDWRPIIEQVPEILKNDCKDLELVAWLIEALCRLNGFKGLTVGFTLAHELIEEYWDELYPTPEPEDLAERLAPLIGLNGIESEGSLIQPIKSIYITDGQSEGPFSTWQYEQAIDVDRLDKEKQVKKIESGSIALEDVELSIKESADSFFIELNNDINNAIEAFSMLSRSMDKAMSGQPQPTSYISQCLKVCSNSVQHIAADILKKSNTSEMNNETESTDETVGSEENKGHFESNITQQMNSRAQAIEQLGLVAEFFRKTEPHSPMSYAIEQVVRWSSLSLPELLQELITDGDARNGYFKLSGIKTEE